MKAQPSKQGAKNTAASSPRSRTRQQLSNGMAVPKPPMFDDVHARITGRAYELYLERGCRDGGAERDWLDAEREILKHTSPV